MKRRDMQNWILGTAPASAQRPGALDLPEDGSGSLARLPRRVVAIFIDWWASWLVALLIFGDSPLGALGIFALQQVILVATGGSSFGHRICGLVVRRLGALSGANLPVGPAGTGFLPALIRTVLLCLVIPAVVWDADGRGLHDKAAGTVLLRR